MADPIETHDFYADGITWDDMTEDQQEATMMAAADRMFIQTGEQEGETKTLPVKPVALETDANGNPLPPPPAGNTPDDAGDDEGEEEEGEGSDETEGEGPGALPPPAPGTEQVPPPPPAETYHFKGRLMERDIELDLTQQQMEEALGAYAWVQGLPPQSKAVVDGVLTGQLVVLRPDDPRLQATPPAVPGTTSTSPTPDTGIDWDGVDPAIKAIYDQQQQQLAAMQQQVQQTTAITQQQYADQQMQLVAQADVGLKSELHLNDAELSSLQNIVGAQGYLAGLVQSPQYAGRPVDAYVTAVKMAYSQSPLAARTFSEDVDAEAQRLATEQAQRDKLAKRKKNAGKVAGGHGTATPAPSTRRLTPDERHAAMVSELEQALAAGES